MADTTARALQVLEWLQSAQQRTVSELAERLSVDERTIRRDVARLQTLGVPIETLRGRYGGYRLAPGHRVLPLMFSSEEVIAVFLGLTRAQTTSQEREITIQTALSKIKRALPLAEAKRIDALLEVMTRTSPGVVAPDPAIMLTLAEAVNTRQVLDLRYNNGKGIPSRRTIHPYGLVAHSDRWYLIALDAQSQAERTFRVDRIRTVRAMRATFTTREIPDVAAHLFGHFVDADYRWRVVLRIRETEEHIRAHLPRSIARLKRLDTEPGWYRAEIHAESLDWIPSVIARLGCEVVIDQPDELREQVRAVARRMWEASAQQSKMAWSDAADAQRPATPQGDMTSDSEEHLRARRTRRPLLH